MTNNTRSHQIWIKIDFWVQAVLMATAIGLSIFSSPFFLLFMAIPISLWQSLSGLTHFFIFKKATGGLI